MADWEDSCSERGAKIAMAFLGGALLGAIGGLLLAPKSGVETREAIKGYVRRTEEELLEKAKELRGELDHVISRGKEFVGEKTAAVTAAYEAGKEAYKKEHAK